MECFCMILFMFEREDVMEKVTETIINVGVNDSSISLFENQYPVMQGMAYNSYVILDDKTAVMDTVDSDVTEEWMKNVLQVLAGRKVDYLIVQHMEPDHAGSMLKLIHQYPEMKIVGSVLTFGLIQQFFGEDCKEKAVIVREGDTLCLGGHTVCFIMAPMVHWPEVFVTYDQTEKVLFSADGFGKFGTRDAKEDWVEEARRYYCNICGKYGPQVQSLLQKASVLDIRTICPLHGPVLTDNLKEYINLYQIWSSYSTEKEGVLIAYASIYGHTEKAVQLLNKYMLEIHNSFKVKILDLCREDVSEAVAQAFSYGTIVLAASTYDTGVFPPMETFLNHLISKNLQKKKIAFIENGSWAPNAAKVMREKMSHIKEISIIEPIITIKTTLTEENQQELKTLAQNLITNENKE